MGLFDKIKNVLFEEEEVEIPVISKEEPKIEPKKIEPVEAPTRFKSTTIKEEREEIVKPVENSPFQSFDEEEFERIAAINRNRLLERDRKAREQKEAEKRRLESSKQELPRTRDYKPTNPREKDYSVYLKPDNKPKENHRFKPSPVISPVYGILDKNYKKEDILPRASSEGTLPKVMDVDRVRQKAFGALEEELEKNEPLKNFYDLDNKEKKVSELISLDESKEEQPLIEEELINTNEIKITNYDESRKELEEVNYATFDDELPTKEENKERTSVRESTLESDLFDLIDSMYENRKDE